MSRRTFLLALSAAAIVGAAALQGDAGAGGPDTEREAARVELGRRLFFDPAIGRQGKIGCASCHDPEHGFSDPRVLSLDETGYLPRHSQPLTDLAGEGFHWDGEFDTVRDVVDARVLPPDRVLAASAARLRQRLEGVTRLEHASDVIGSMSQRFVKSNRYYGVDLVRPSAVDVISPRIAAGGRYAPGFAAAFGDAAVTPERVGDALESYLRSLATTTNAYDRFATGDPAALTPSARRGLDLFRGSAGCVKCHAEGPRATFSDGKFHNTGVEARRGTRASDAGRLATHFRYGERRAFKTPSLRDVARRAPYFHDGSAATLADVVRYYDAGGTEDEHLDENMRPLRLSEADVEDLVAFLASLTGDERAGLGRATPMRSATLAVRVLRPDGTPAANVRVRANPLGDRVLAEVAAAAAPVGVTDGEGNATLAMPAATHVVVEIRGRVRSRALPDWTRTVTIVDLPDAAVTLRVCVDGDASLLPDRFILQPPRSRTDDLIGADDPVFERVGSTAPGELLYTLVEEHPDMDDAGFVRQRIAILDPGIPVEVDRTPGAVTELSLSTASGAADSTVRARLDTDVRALLRRTGR